MSGDRGCAGIGWLVYYWEKGRTPCFGFNEGTFYRGNQATRERLIECIAYVRYEIELVSFSSLNVVCIAIAILACLMNVPFSRP